MKVGHVVAEYQRLKPGGTNPAGQGHCCIIRLYYWKIVRELKSAFLLKSDKLEPIKALYEGVGHWSEANSANEKKQSGSHLEARESTAVIENKQAGVISRINRCN